LKIEGKKGGHGPLGPSPKSAYVKDTLLEYFAANDAENVASKYQTLVTKNGV